MLNFLSIPATIDECIELAAEYLPEGYEIKISVEKNGYGVHLEDPECAEFDVNGDDGIRSDIIRAINEANGFI